jgi:prevent-host-death family protein
MITMSVGAAKSRFSEMISRAAAGERFVIERREKPIAVVISVEELARLEGRANRAVEAARAYGLDEEIVRGVREGALHPIMAVYGALADQPEWDVIAKDIYKNRRRKSRRKSVEL